MAFYATRLLIRKNFNLSFRDTGSLATVILSPFLVMLLMYFDQLSIDSGSTFVPELLDTPNPESFTVTTIPRCVPRVTSSCLTIAYTPNNDSRINDWVSQVADRSDIPPEEVRGFPSVRDLNTHFNNTPNTTQAAYVFNDYTLERINDGHVSFIVQYNYSYQANFPLGTTLFDREAIIPAMVHQMNVVMMEHFSNRTIDISLNTSVFPHPAIVDEEAFDAFGNNGALLTFATYFIVLIAFFYRMVNEKERGLRDAMRLACQTQAQHYISWFIPFFFVNLIVTMLLIVFGVIFRFNVFKNVEFLVYFLTMFFFSLSLIGWTFLFVSLVNKSFTVNTLAFNIFIFGYIISAGAEFIYSDDFKRPLVLRPIFAISPITLYVRTINLLAVQSNLPIKPLPLRMATVGSFPEVYPVRTSWLWILGSGLFAMLISMYLDNVIATPHGTPLSPLYFLKPSYWFNRKSADVSARFDAILAGDDDDENVTTSGEADQNHFGGTLSSDETRYNPNVEDEDVRLEREAVARGDRDDAALVIKSLSKKFRNHMAVDDVSFSVPRNTAFALLGANGAGKSTIFKMATTTLKPTAGDATIYGLSARYDRQAVRKLIGVCPQFDIFWTTLTGAEHIRLFAALRGYTKNQCDKEVQERLNDVDLWSKKADVYAGEYSGGMQRRLSVAIALTGNPRVIFLDECTSGADPLVRRDLWGAIQRAKKGRVVFMITHSIAEAQYIAGHNRIGIMAKGKLRVLGNALRLKSKFGAGLSLVVVLQGDDSTAKHLLTGLQTICPNAQYVGASAGEREGDVVASFSFVRNTPESQVVASIQMLENEKESYKIRDYSINSTSLDEVFKSITSLSEDAVEKGDDAHELAKDDSGIMS